MGELQWGNRYRKVEQEPLAFLSDLCGLKLSVALHLDLEVGF
jgi:hypothetical protein